MVFYVYSLYSSKCDKFYVGHTEFLQRRVDEHNQNKGGKFSSSCLPWELVYSEEFPSRTAAIQREREIKGRKSRKYILSLTERK